MLSFGLKPIEGKTPEGQASEFIHRLKLVYHAPNVGVSKQHGTVARAATHALTSRRLPFFLQDVRTLVVRLEPMT